MFTEHSFLLPPFYYQLNMLLFNLFTTSPDLYSMLKDFSFFKDHGSVNLPYLD